MFLFYKLEYKVEELFESRPPLLFADFLRRGVELQDRIYDEVKDYNILLKIITDYMEEETKLNLVLFRDAVEHLSRMTRVLRQQRGHYMLVGVGGSGKKSLTTLAAVLAGATCDTLESKKNYGKKEFKEDLFRMMCRVAIDNKIIAFSFSET
jgi:dynein heavy chain